MTTIWRPYWLIKPIEPVKEEVPDDDVPDVKVEPPADDDGINGEDGTTRLSAHTRAGRTTLVRVGATAHRYPRSISTTGKTQPRALLSLSPANPTNVRTAEDARPNRLRAREAYPLGASPEP